MSKLSENNTTQELLNHRGHRDHKVASILCVLCALCGSFVPEDNKA